MNKQSIPKWPLLAADALIFLAVVAISYPNIVLMETMSGTTTMLCCALVLAGMLAVLTPYFLEYRLSEKKISDDAKKTRENIDLIFENLSALQLMIAETKEMGDNIEEKLAFQLVKDTDLKFEEFTKSLDAFRSGVKAKVKELSVEIERIRTQAADALAESESNAIKFDEIIEKISALQDLVDEIGETTVQETAEEEEQEPDDAAIRQETESAGAPDPEESMLEEQTPEDCAEQDADAEGESFETPADESEPEADVLPDEDGGAETDPIGDSEAEAENIFSAVDAAAQQQSPASDAAAETESEGASKLSGLMSKALGNAASVAGSVEKFINNSVEKRESTDAQQPDGESVQNAPTPAAETPDVESPDAEMPEDASAAAAPSETPPPTQNADDAVEVVDDDILDGLDFDEKKNDAPDNTLTAQASAAEPQKEAAPAPAEQKAEHQKPLPIEEMLFADLPMQKKAVRSKGDTEIVLKTIIGIGNKPFVRGNNSILSTEKGVSMDYVEIGVWRIILPPFEGSADITIWKNDEEQMSAPFTVEAGSKKEISI